MLLHQRRQQRLNNVRRNEFPVDGTDLAQAKRQKTADNVRRIFQHALTKKYISPCAAEKRFKTSKIKIVHSTKGNTNCKLQPQQRFASQTEWACSLQAVA